MQLAQLVSLCLFQGLNDLNPCPFASKKDVTFALWPLRFLLQLEILEGFVLLGEVFYFSF